MVTLGTAWGHLPFIQRPQSGQRCPGVPRHKWPLSVCPGVLCHSGRAMELPDSGGCLLGRGFGSSAWTAASLLLSGSSLQWTQVLMQLEARLLQWEGRSPSWNAAGRKEDGPGWQASHVPGFVLAVAQMSVHLFCSGPLPGRWHPPYATDEVKEAHREGICPVTQPVWSTPRCVSFQSTRFVSLKEMRTAWTPLSLDAVWPETPGCPIPGPSSSVRGMARVIFQSAGRGGRVLHHTPVSDSVGLE